MICLICHGKLKELLKVSGLRFGQCTECSMIQLVNPRKPKVKKPVYSEPEDHIVALGYNICNLPLVKKVFGVSFKDVTLLDELCAEGLKTKLLFNENIGVEVIQEKLTIKKAEALAKQHGPADMVVARHILEHCHNPLEFLRALKRLVKPGGYLLLEVPDTEFQLRKLDYTTLWDEHTLYFTESSLAVFIGITGLLLDDVLRFEYPYEDSLVAVTRVLDMSEGLRLGERFGNGLRDKELYWMGKLKDIENVALFGAGHLSKAFVEHYRLWAFVDVVIDDDPKKQGKKFCGIPVKSSDAIKNYDLVLLGVNPMHHNKIKKKHKGVKFVSIFPKKGADK